MIAWEKVSKREMVVIRRIAKRGHGLLLANGVDSDLTSVEMDVAAAHAGCPLDLKALEAADDLNFAHDICGIRRHLDRETGELRDFFVPRCALARSI